MLWTQGVGATTVKPAGQPNIKKIQNYVFNLNEILGAGNFSRVYKAVNQVSNQVSAIKVVELANMKNPTLINLLYSQIEILKNLKHPNILNCIQVFSSNNNCYIITQLCNEGDLESRIRDKGSMSEMQARKIIYETFSALKYLSDNQIIHRDLKVANIFINNGVSKIADFGFAKKLKSADERFKDINIGSPIYMSPEGLLTNCYGPKTDVWAFGVFIYEILHGDTPLAFCQSEAELYSNLKVPLTKDKMLANLSNELKDLMLRCLSVDQNKRISFQQMYNHPYIIYLRKLYEKPEPVINTPKQITQAQKFKASESTYISQQSTYQAESEALINQYNNMSLNQRANSQMTVGSPSSQASTLILGTNNMMMTQSPQMSLTQTPVLPTSPKIATLNQTTTNQTGCVDIPPSNIINSVITFPQCVQLLHYCRLAFKCYNYGKQSKSCAKLNPFLSNWILSLMSEISKKQTTHVTFAGDRAVLRQQKLHEVISQYDVKYRAQLTWSPGYNIDLQSLQALIVEAEVSLDGEMKTCRNPSDLELRVRLAHYLYSLQEANLVVKKSIETKDFAPMASAKIEDFLNRKPETFTLESYGSFRNKICLN